MDESTAERPRFITWATSVTGDVDNDGQIELITFIADGFVVQDMASGRIQHFLLEAIGLNRNYGTFAVTDFDADGTNELLVLGDLVDMHLVAFRFKGAEKNLALAEELRLGMAGRSQLLTRDRR